MPSDYLNLVEVLHRQFLNVQTSSKMVLYSQTAWNYGSLSLVKMSNFVLLCSGADLGGVQGVATPPPPPPKWSESQYKMQHY